jgi:hypothetical protein
MLRTHGKQIGKALGYVHLPAIQLAQLLLLACGLSRFTCYVLNFIVLLYRFLINTDADIDRVITAIYAVFAIPVLSYLGLISWEAARPTSTSHWPQRFTVMELFQSVLKHGEPRVSKPAPSISGKANPWIDFITGMNFFKQTIVPYLASMNQLGGDKHASATSRASSSSSEDSVPIPGQWYVADPFQPRQWS